jgi:Tfp pilus assembly protein PilN
MKNLNLLRSRLDKYYHRMIIRRIFIFYFTGLLVICGFISLEYFNKKREVRREKKAVNRIEKQLLEEKELIRRLTNYQKETDKYLRQIQAYKNALEEKVIWTPKLLLFSQSLPSGVFLRKISWDKDKNSFIVEGFVAGESERRERLSAFITSLKKNNRQEFKDIVLNRAARETSRKGEIALRFELKCVTTGEEDNAKVAKSR